MQMLGGKLTELHFSVTGGVELCFFDLRPFAKSQMIKVETD